MELIKQGYPQQEVLHSTNLIKTKTTNLEASPPQSVSVHQLIPARPGMLPLVSARRNLCQKKTGETGLCRYPLKIPHGNPTKHVLGNEYAIVSPLGKWTACWFELGWTVRQLEHWNSAG